MNDGYSSWSVGLQALWVSGYSVRQGREGGWVSAGHRGPCFIGKEQAQQHHDTL